MTTGFLPSLPDGKRSGRLSKDGKWRSFSRVPHLLQYVPSATFYARVKVNGKVIRQSLATAARLFCLNS